jgi:hypothetical protein
MLHPIGPDTPYEYDATRIDIYIAALLQGAIYRGKLSLRLSGVSADDEVVIQRIIDLAALASLKRDEKFYGKVPK